MPLLFALAYCLRNCHEAWPISSSFLGGGSSLLIHLVLRNMVLQCNNLSFPALIHLQLRQVAVHDSAACFLSLLEGSPLLKYLALHNIMLPQPGKLTQPVSLPVLATLCLASIALSMIVLVQLLPIPTKSYQIEALGHVLWDNVDKQSLWKAKSYTAAQCNLKELDPTSSAIPHLVQIDNRYQQSLGYSTSNQSVCNFD